MLFINKCYASLLCTIIYDRLWCTEWPVQLCLGYIKKVQRNIYNNEQMNSVNSLLIYLELEATGVETDRINKYLNVYIMDEVI